MIDTGPQTYANVSQIPLNSKGKKQGCLLKMHPMDLNSGMMPIGEKPFLIGREEYCSLTITEDAVSRSHAEIRLDKESDGYLLTDLGSTNGTFLNDERVGEKHLTLKAGDTIRIGTHVYKYLTSDHIEAQYHEAAYSMMTTDGLTNVWNKRYFLDMLNREIRRAVRAESPLTLLMLDMDHFKNVNDQHGHLIGDEVLREFALRLSNQLREEDLLARYGGEEFSITLFDTNLEQANVVARRCLKSISTAPFQTTAGEISCTVSIGGATFLGRPPETGTDKLIQFADASLYKAKESGRNQIVIGEMPKDDKDPAACTKDQPAS